MLTRRDLDAIAERLTGRDPACELVLLRARLAEAWAVLDAVAREPSGGLCREAAILLLRQHGVAGWGAAASPPPAVTR